MVAYLGIIVVGIVVRGVDRWWFSSLRGRRRVGTLREVMACQRERANDLTPAVLLAGHWVEWVGWCGVATYGGLWGLVAAAMAGAVKFLHLQEVSHFAVHGVLTRSSWVSTVLSEAAVHAPLGFVPVPVRRETHVRRHHPNATVAGVDPNLAELRDAGLRPGVGAGRFALAVVSPLTPTGFAATCRTLVANLRRGPWWRPVGFAVAPAAAGLLLGWPAAVFVFAVPRLLLYPQLAWLSLLVEHRWFDAEQAIGSPVAVEAARCLRLYARNPLLSLLARGTWLPYGDLFHFAHSAHPAVRWNYLPALERSIGAPSYAPRALLFGTSAVVPHHRRALVTRPAAQGLARSRPDVPVAASGTGMRPEG